MPPSPIPITNYWDICVWAAKSVMEWMFIIRKISTGVFRMYWHHWWYVPDATPHTQPINAMSIIAQFYIIGNAPAQKVLFSWNISFFILIFGNRFFLFWFPGIGLIFCFIIYCIAFFQNYLLFLKYIILL